MPVIAYLEDDLQSQFYETLARHRVCIMKAVEGLKDPEYLNPLMDAYNVEKTDAIVGLLSALIEDINTRVRKATDMPFEIYPSVQDELI